MLRIVPTPSAARAKTYYRHSDYYAGDQELPGVWRGLGAERLGLAGLVEKPAFDALCDNRHPTAGGPLTPRTDDRRTAGYDFNFHAPKSLSLLHALTGDERLLGAFRDAVDATMNLIEADAKTRVRIDGRSEDRVTGNLVWGRFDHLTARPIDGVPDPHLHSHCFVFNATFDAEEDRWKAGQFRDLKRDAPFYQAAFHADLAGRLRTLGVPLAPTRTGWEIDGLTRETLEKFSRRTAIIERVAAEKGIDAPDEKAELGAKTRKGKAADLSMDELRRVWADRLDADEADAISLLADRVTDTRDPAHDPHAAREALAYAADHLFERQAVVPERTLLAATLHAGHGAVSLTEAAAAVRDSDVLVREVDGRRLATTRAVLAEEDRVVGFARAGRGTCVPLGPADRPIEREWLNAGQRAAVRHVLTSPDRVILVRGAAGAGKTALMQEAASGIAAGGKRVLAFAPSAAAGRGVLRQEGFASADTVARFLVDERLQDEARGQVVWIDEAGLLGTRSMARLFELAGRLDCRVVLAGDRRQHGSVERGVVLRVLEDHAGLVPAEVTEIQRQKGDYKTAVQLLADGRTGAGLAALESLGWVKEVADADRYETIAADYLESVKSGRTALVVSPTHAEGADVTAAVRAALRAAGRLDADDQNYAALVPVNLTEAERGRAENYRPGDVLQFHQNAQGHQLGDRVVVTEGTPLPLDKAARFQVFRPAELPLAAGDVVRVTKGGKTADGHRLETGGTFTVAGVTPAGGVRLHNGWVVAKEFGHLAHGYVSTSHAAQGRTVDRVLLAQSSRSAGAASKEQFYVSASRGRERLTVYTDDAAALRDAVERSDPRTAATELMRAARRDHVRLRGRVERLAGRDAGRRPPAVERPVLQRKEAGRDR